ncbi:CHAT domain-containing protein [Streptomyces sp. NPDC049040]|uniref:CHAT domain-containing protein n=1 Tax=Streptomyces sp. NPDC049040 TaxID=3365593 RepID=UPI00372296C0
MASRRPRWFLWVLRQPALRRATRVTVRERYPRRIDRLVARWEALAATAGREQRVRLLEAVAALHGESARRGDPAAWARAVDTLERAAVVALPDASGGAALPAAAAVLVELAEARMESAEATGDTGMVREAVASVRRGVDAVGDDRATRIMVLSAAGVVLLRAGSALAEPGLLAEAAGAVTDALAAGGGSRLNLAYAWRLRYEFTGDADDLGRAEQAASEAVAECLEHGLDVAEEYAELAQVLRYRFAEDGDRETAERATQAARGALAATGPADGVEGLRRACLLAGLLTERHAAGHPDALTEAVTLVRAALSAGGSAGAAGEPGCGAGEAVAGAGSRVAEGAAGAPGEPGGFGAAGAGAGSREGAAGAVGEPGFGVAGTGAGSREGAGGAVGESGGFGAGGAGAGSREGAAGAAGECGAGAGAGSRVAEGAGEGPDFQVAQVAAAVLTAWAAERQDTGVSREAEAAARAAVSAAGEDEERRAVALDTLADVLHARFRLTDEVGLLDEAITLGEAAAALAVGIPADRAGYLGNLGIAHFDRYGATGTAADLAAAIRRHRQALELTGPGHPGSGMHLNNLGLALTARARAGDRAAADDAIGAARAAVERAAPGTDLAHRLSNLGGALYERYTRFGDLADLDEDIDSQRAAVAAAESAAGHPDLPGLRSNLATALTERYDCLGTRDDLAEAVAELRTALAGPARPPDFATISDAYGMALHSWYEATGEEAALGEAVLRLRAAVAGSLAGDPDLPLRINNLVVSLRASSARLGGAAGEAGGDAAEEAVGTARAALAALAERHTATPGASEAGGPGRALRSALALALHARGRDGDLDEAVDLSTSLVADIPADEPLRAQELANLAFLLDARHTRSADRDDVFRAMTALRAAALAEAGNPGVRMRAARSWGRLAAERGLPAQAARAFALAVELLPAAAPRRLERPDAQRWLTEFAGLASDAAAMALACDDPERALALLESGRGVLLNRTLGIRTDTAEVRAAAPALADRFDALRDELDALDAHRATGAQPHGGAHRERRRDLERELALVVEAVRSLPVQGAARFQRLPDVAELLEEAAEGPVAVVNISSYRCDALLLTGGGLRTVPLPGLDADGLEETVARFHRDARTAGDGELPEDDPAAEAARERVTTTLDLLWHAVAAPVLDALLPHPAEPAATAAGAGADPAPSAGAERRLWWVPTQALCQLPLHAATDRDTGACVLDVTVPSYTPTVTALHHARRRAGAEPEAYEAAVIHVGGATADGVALPAAAREVRHVAGLFGVEPMDAARAPREALTAAVATCTHLHLALHAKADPDDPGDSRFLLPRLHLTVGEIAALRNTAGRLAYLSACETTHTVAHLVDEAVHLTSALQLVGFAEVIGTQWRIPDPVAEWAARHFYAELAGCPGDASVALARTARRLRDRFAPYPEVWAPLHHAGR